MAQANFTYRPTSVRTAQLLVRKLMQNSSQADFTMWIFTDESELELFPHTGK